MTHVGEKMFAFDAACVAQNNPGGLTPPAAPPGYSLPAGDTGMKAGWNCIKYWVDLRPAFLAQIANGAAILNIGVTAGALPNVLHYHNLAANPVTQRAYMALHSIHNAEHTGLDDEAPSATSAEEDDEGGHAMGRYVAAVGLPSAIDGGTKLATADVRMIDLSHGYSALTYPDSHDIQSRLGLTALLNSFVHAHFLWVDPGRKTVLVSGEHTGNLGVIDETTDALTQVIPISRTIPACTPTPEPGQTLIEAEEPHVHGVVIQPQTGVAYISDEGESCFYESVTILKPSN